MLASVPHDSDRVLILSASIGGGHVACGRALLKAFGSLGATAEHVDLLEHTAAPFRRLYRQAYFDLVRNVPDLVDWVGKRMDRRPTEVATVQRRLRSRVTRMLSYEMPRVIDRFRPGALVHTHFLGPEIVAGRLRRRSPLPQAEVITDFFAHSLWLRPGIARYYVASDEIRVHLRSAGVDEHRVRVSGIPIDPRFMDLPDRAAARRAASLDPERDVLLIMAGGMEAGDLKNVLAQLAEFRWSLSVVVICGRSADLLKVAHAEVNEHAGPVHFRVFGFVDDVPTYMAAADLLVTKPGGMTVSEALAAGLPLVLINPYPLQEEANANALLENGVAVRVDPLSTFALKLRRLLEDAERLADMRSAALRLARPDAAMTVARSVLDELVVGSQERGRN
jgi:processive 1,2-diacylglycerol beta-glucosyltransferase